MRRKQKTLLNVTVCPSGQTTQIPCLMMTEIDAIYVATPPSYHLEYTQRALAAGKHVYVEKPMARNGDEARQILELAEGSKQKVVVAHYRRKLPLFMRIDEILKSGELGKARHVSIQLIQPEHDPLIALSERELACGSRYLRRWNIP